MADDIVERLKARTCPAGEPWTADDPSTDHGHTDCWLYWLAINEIKRLRAVLDAIDALHQPDSDLEICDQCLFEWPCPTHLLLHPEEARRG